MTLTPDDLDRRLRALADGVADTGLPTGAEVRAEAHRRHRRNQRLTAAACLVVVAGGLGAVVALRGSTPTRVPAAAHPTTTTAPTTTLAPTTTTTVPASTTTEPPPTTTTTTVPPGELAAASAALGPYLRQRLAALPAAAEAAGDAAKVAAEVGASGQAPYLDVSSAPVVDQGQVIAVAAFDYDATGRTIDVLAYEGGGWVTVAQLSPGASPPAVPVGFTHYLFLVPRVAVDVADVTGDGQPDFLIHVQAADNVPGLVVTEAAGGWAVATGTQGGTSSDLFVRNAEFVDGQLETTYDDCTPNCAQGTDTQVIWTWDPSTGAFTAPPNGG